MTCKYTGFHAAERVEAFMAKAHIKEYVDGILSFFRHSPTHCLVPSRENIQARFSGTKLGVKTRSLVFHASGHAIPSGGFLAPICGCTGCVNPKHQRIRIKLKEVPLFEGIHYIIDNPPHKVYNPFEDDAATRELVDHMKSRAATQASHEIS